MKREIQIRFLIILLIAGVSFLFTAPIQNWLGDNAFTQKFTDKKVTLGLDLAGGTELDYRVDLSDIEKRNNDEDPANDVNETELEDLLNRVQDAIEKRVNPAGIGEIVVKRSQFDEEEHILVQMPPGTDIAKAKADAERDNKLEFFAEDPALEAQAKIDIATHLASLTNANWDEKVTELQTSEDITVQAFEDRFESDLHDSSLKETLLAAQPGTIIQQVLDTSTETETTFDPETGAVGVKFWGEPVFGIIRVNSIQNAEKEQEVKAKATARHILISYQGAQNAAEDVPYATKEEAQAKAQELLEQIKANGTDNFAELAQEWSNGPSSTKGGDLGEFEPGTMVTAFNDAVFERTEPGLVQELVETPFGFHIIDVNAVTQASKTTVTEKQLDYDLIGWPKQDLRWEPTELGGNQLEKADVGYDELNKALVNLYFSDEGAKMFGDLTQKVANRKCDGSLCRLGIKVGGNFITTPTVSQQINSRNAQITGNFTYDSARDLAYGLNLGAIDAPVELSGQITIQAELGAEQLAKSIKAGMIGLGLTILFMIVMYRWAGFVAGIALSLYAGIFITLLKVWPASLGGPIVLTLAGAAGMALSLGLAVDGNILIFERVKEELKKGRDIFQAVDLGFSRAWTAIKDSNLTTLITCIILYNLGSAMIKGFAITLIVGTLLSMFTAVFVSRNLLRFFLLFKPFQKTALYGVTTEGIKKAKKIGAKVRTRKSKKK